MDWWIRPIIPTLQRLVQRLQVLCFRWLLLHRMTTTSTTKLLTTKRLICLMTASTFLPSASECGLMKPPCATWPARRTTTPPSKNGWACWTGARRICRTVIIPDLDMGPFLRTQCNPIHELMDPIQSNFDVNLHPIMQFIRIWYQIELVNYVRVRQCWLLMMVKNDS